MVQTLSKKQIEILEKRAIRKYKEQLKDKIIGIFGFIAIEAVFVGGIIYNFMI